MPSLAEITQLCRLCLVKDQVNIPIFNGQGDIQQIFHKISTCLPVKISQEDGLPKNICDGCSHKLDMFYQFWNTSSNSEKQLLQWLKEIERSLSLEKDASVQQSHSICPDDDVVLKQEAIDIDEHNADDGIPTDDLNVPTDPDYLLQQSYGSFDYQQEAYNEEAATSNAAGPSSTVTSETAAVAAPKRKRRAAAMKPLPPQINSEDEDDPDAVETKIAKTEKLSDDEDESNPEPTTFVGLPTDNEQPGPSGVDKVTGEAPSYLEESSILKKLIIGPSMSVTIQPNPNFAKKKNPHKPLYTFEDYNNLLQIKQSCKKKYPEGKASRNKINKSNDELTDQNKEETVEVIKEQEEIKKKGNNPKRKTNKSNKCNKSKNEKVHCDICNTTFKNNILFALHSLKHSTNGRYSCHMCTYTSASKYHFEMHVRAHEGSTKYKCEICNKAFTVSTHAAEHKYFHTGEKPFQCEICGKHFMFSWFLTSHRRTQHWEIVTGTPLVKYDCTICNKHYTSSTGLKRHKSSQHNEEGIDTSVLCDTCGKRLASKEKLKFHRRIHTGYKPFSCNVCPKSFTRKEQLKEHERVHTGEKPFICKQCGKGFTQRSPLKIHIRTHTGERPYICRLCNKGFISKGVMDTHMKNCEGIYIIAD